MRFNSIKYIALLVLAAATVAGCTKAPAPDLGEELNVLLQMSVGTKAVTETDGTPTDAESAIHTLRVYAFVDGQAAGHFYTSDYAALEGAAGTASGAAKHFLMDIKMYSLGSRDVDFYVIANEEAMVTAGSAPAGFDENTTEAELNRFTFTSLNLSNGMALGLPMCCKKTETIDFADDDSNNPQTVPGHEGHTLLAQKLSFELERPVGKIGVFGDVFEIPAADGRPLDVHARAEQHVDPLGDAVEPDAAPHAEQKVFIPTARHEAHVRVTHAVPAHAVRPVAHAKEPRAVPFGDLVAALARKQFDFFFQFQFFLPQHKYFHSLAL